MKFQEILPFLLKGEKCIKKSFAYCKYLVLKNRQIVNDIGNEIFLSGYHILVDDWELYEEPKQKVKYYPSLIKNYNDNFFIDSHHKFKKEEEAKIFHMNSVDTFFIRLVTEISELIDEREE